MVLITLKKILRKEGGRILEQILAASNELVGILDVDGQLLFGTLSVGEEASDTKVPLQHQGQIVGWVVGEKDSKWKSSVAVLMEFIISQETEKKALASEVLDKYRELHLLYRLSEKLATSPLPQAIGQLAVNEICDLVNAISGMAVLVHEETNELDIVAQCGQPLHIRPSLHDSGGIIRQVIQTGIAQTINQERSADFFLDLEEPAVSLLCAPLKTEKRILGALILVGDISKPFTSGDLKLINAIAMQASPAIEIAHLHKVELEKVRLERDLQTARQVQLGMLPNRMPVLEGWGIAAFWQPARMVSGDLYDFIYFPDGKLGLVIADVTDKGVPAALLMANTRSVMRGVVASADRRGSESPGKLLKQVNDVLYEEMPMNMFVTCLLVILDPVEGKIRYASAGHNPPYLSKGSEVIELRATGVPLGIFPDMEYDDKEAILAPEDSLLMYSDGLVEAHNPQGDMFGTQRLREMLRNMNCAHLHGETLIQHLMAQLVEFSGSNWAQEDDVTLIALHRDR